MLTFLCFSRISANQNSSGSSTKLATDMSDTLPADLCMRMVSGRVREILDLLALSGNEIGCAEAHRFQKMFKSVIQALDELHSACCRPPQVNIPNFILDDFIFYLHQRLFKRSIKIKIYLTH